MNYAGSASVCAMLIGFLIQSHLYFWLWLWELCGPNDTPLFQLIIQVNTMVGVTVLLVGFSLLLLLLAFNRGRSTSFRASSDGTIHHRFGIFCDCLSAFIIVFLCLPSCRMCSHSVISTMYLVVAVCCWIAFIFWVIFSISNNFSFVSVSAVFLSFNLLPLTYLVFFMTHGGTKDVGADNLCEEGRKGICDDEGSLVSPCFELYTCQIIHRIVCSC